MFGRVGRTGHHFLSSEKTRTHDLDGRSDGLIKGWRVGRCNRSQLDSFASLHSRTLITSLGHVILHSCPDDPELRSESACGLHGGVESVKIATDES